MVAHLLHARTANRFGKLPLHFIARNPTLTRTMLSIVLGAYPGAAEAKDLAGNLPLHCPLPPIERATFAACGRRRLRSQPLSAADGSARVLWNCCPPLMAPRVRPLVLRRDGGRC